MAKKKQEQCDIIIPIYNAPEWVKLCVYAVIKNTKKELIHKIYLMNDNSNKDTLDCLNNLKEKYGDIIELVTNKENLGFVKNCNKALKMSTADYALLLNSDCLVSNNTVGKLIDHIKNNHKIGLICPVASNAANITLEMFEGFSYTKMDRLLEKKFKGMNFDACTVVGNCLMITKECLEKTGYLDEIYGMGYGEETDYQFKAMEQGFEAKIAIDTYVFHKAEVSFGVSEEKQKRLQHNRDIFFSRWQAQYDALARKYQQNDPIQYIQSHLTEEDKQLQADTLFYLPYFVQNAGGCHLVADMINYMNINGYDCNVLYNNVIKYQEIMLFHPIPMKKINEVDTRQIVSTIWDSTFYIEKVTREKQIPVISFIQGYEPYFENGGPYGLIELTYKMVDDRVTISKYLQKRIKDLFHQDCALIPNAVNYDLLHHQNKNKSVKTITIILRGGVMKGDFLLLDILKMIDNRYKNLNVNVVYMNKYQEFPNLSNKTIKYNKILGPVSRNEINHLLKQTDVYIDASLNEGFGLTALEALCSGAVPIVSESFGIDEYMKDGKNGYIIKNVNNADCYVDKLDKLINDQALFQSLKAGCEKTAKEHDYDDNIDRYIKFFQKKRTVTEKVYTEKEQELIKVKSLSFKESSKLKKFVYKVIKKTPKRLHEKAKRVITTLYNMYQK